MAVTEFGPTATARSVMPFGTSGRRSSPHFFDQAELYSTQKLKPAWFSDEEVEQHAVSTLKLQRLKITGGKD